MMRALSLLQPYATLIACGQKTIETRSWATSYRGPLLIAASKGFPPEYRALCEEWPFDEDLAAAGYPSWRDLPRAAIVAVATLATCRPTTRGGTLDLTGWEHWRDVCEGTQHEVYYGDYSPRRFGWLLADVRRLPEPVPCVGALGLWDVPAGVQAHVAEQLGRVAP